MERAGQLKDRRICIRGDPGVGCGVSRLKNLIVEITDQTDKLKKTIACALKCQCKMVGWNPDSVTDLLTHVI